MSRFDDGMPPEQKITQHLNAYELEEWRGLPESTRAMIIRAFIGFGGSTVAEKAKQHIAEASSAITEARQDIEKALEALK